MAIEPVPRAWITRAGYFQQVTGYAEALDILNDRRFKANLVGLFEGLGVTSGPLWEIMAASFMSMDGDRHRHFRSMVAGHFTPRAVESVRTLARTTALAHARQLADGGGGDMLDGFAVPLVTATTCAHIGLPPSDVSALAKALEQISSGTRDLANRLPECAQGISELVTYGQRAIDERRARPTNDLITQLAEHIEGGELPEPIALSLLAGLLSAGHEPTVNQIGLMVLSLCDNPSLWDDLADGTLEVPRAVEELLRFRSTNQGVNRRVDEALTFNGVEFKEGQQILIGIGDANRDPSRFPKAEEIDPIANRASHLAFGFGPHHCLGAALARLQLQEALRSLTSTMRCPTIVAASVPEGTGLIGPTQLTIACEARS